MTRWLRWAWPAVIVVAWGGLLIAGADPRTVLSGPAAALQGSAWFGVALLAAFLVRSVVLLPATLLTVLAGFALGAVGGTLVALLGTTASALLAYGLARGVMPGGGSDASTATSDPQASPRPTRKGDAGSRRPGWNARIRALRDRLRRDAFGATLVARLALVPGDLVNLAAGSARVPWRPFAAATALGGAPGLLAAVLAGASLQGAFDPEAVRIGWGPLAASALLAVLTIVGGVWLRRRNRS